MGNFERLSVLVIVVIIVLIVVIALVQLTESNETTLPSADGTSTSLVGGDAGMASGLPPPPVDVPAPGPFGGNRAPGPIEFAKFLTPPAPPPTPVEPPAPAPVVAKVEEPKVHVVQPNETIAKIAKVYFPAAVTKGTDAILRANPSVDPTRMRVGTKLTIPVLAGATPANGGSTSTGEVSAVRPPTPTASISPGGTYTTKKGESLASISRKAYGREDRWQDIWLANYDALDAESLEKLAGGIRLKIPR